MSFEDSINMWLGKTVVELGETLIVLAVVGVICFIAWWFDR